MNANKGFTPWLPPYLRTFKEKYGDAYDFGKGDRLVYLCAEHRRRVYYEFFGYDDDRLGVELHIGSTTQDRFAEVKATLTNFIGDTVYGKELEWDDWYGGRLRLMFNRDDDPVVVAEAMQALIQHTKDAVVEALEPSA